MIRGFLPATFRYIAPIEWLYRSRKLVFGYDAGRSIFVVEPTYRPGCVDETAVRDLINSRRDMDTPGPNR